MPQQKKTNNTEVTQKDGEIVLAYPLIRLSTLREVIPASGHHNVYYFMRVEYWHKDDAYRKSIERKYGSVFNVPASMFGISWANCDERPSDDTVELTFSQEGNLVFASVNRYFPKTTKITTVYEGNVTIV